MAMTAYEDIYLAINDIDGPEWTDKLRARMSDKGATASTGSLEDSWLLSANAV